jgi:hypothetical protein
MPSALHADGRRRLRRARWFSAQTVMALALFGQSSILAHEPGVGRAVVTLPSAGECVVDLTVDAASLLARLEVQAGRQRSGPLPGPEAAARIFALQDELMKHVRIRVDGVDTPAVLDTVREAPDASQTAGFPVAAEVRLRMHGTVSPGAKSATWRYDLTFTRYALTVNEADGVEHPVEWLEGGQESRPFSVGRMGGGRSPLRIAAAMYGGRALSYVRANAFGCLVVVVGLVPFRRRFRASQT